MLEKPLFNITGNGDITPNYNFIKYPQNDTGNAQRFVTWLHGRVIYVPELKTWYAWDGRNWREDNDGGIMRLADEHACELLAAAAKMEDQDKRDKAGKHALGMGNVKPIQSMLEMVRCHRDIVVHLDRLDTNPFLLGVQNGVVNLRTGKFRQAQRQEFVTRKAGTRYDAKADCPVWKRVLNEVMGGNQELVTYIQKYIGYTLTGDTSDQSFFFLVGGGRNGKSTVVELVQKLLGQYGQRASQSVFVANPHGNEPSNDLARLAGARFVVGSEVEEGSRLAENRIKDLTGGDTITGRFLYKQPFDFRPVLKLWLFGNHKPEIRGADDGIWRRIRLIPFTVQIAAEKVDPYLSAKLAAELPGVLNWALAGVKMWLAEGLKAPAVVLDAGVQYREEEDLFGEFLTETTVSAPNLKVRRRALYAAYKEWSEEQGHRHYLAAKGLVRRMRDRGIVEGRDANGRYWLGLALRPRNEDWEDALP